MQLSQDQIIACAMIASSELQAQARLSFLTADSWLVYADLYGKGERGVVLAHGGRFNKVPQSSRLPQ